MVRGKFRVNEHAEQENQGGFLPAVVFHAALPADGIEGAADGNADFLGGGGLAVGNGDSLAHTGGAFGFPLVNVGNKLLHIVNVAVAQQNLSQVPEHLVLGGALHGQVNNGRVQDGTKIHNRLPFLMCDMKAGSP